VPRFFFEKDIKIWKNITQGIMEHDVGWIPEMRCCEGKTLFLNFIEK
jgi:hypothetical protein